MIEQFEAILYGVRWQLIVVALAAGALTEQVKQFHWIQEARQDGASKMQRTAMWAVNGFLPETICVLGCLFVPGVLDESINRGTAAFIGYLTGTFASKLHDLFLGRMYGALAHIGDVVFKGRGAPPPESPSGGGESK
jgi:hypothetical protein